MSIAGPIRWTGWALIALAAAASPGLAQDMPAWFSVTPPKEFVYLSQRSEDITGNLRQESQFGTLSFNAHAAMWASAPPPATADAALVITWITTTEAVSDPGAAVRGQLDRMRAIPEAASLSPDEAARETTIDQWDQALDQGMATGRLSWRHKSNQTESTIRTIIARSSQDTLYQVSAECLRSTGSDAAAWDRCQAALDSLAITLPADQRQALASLDGPAEPEAAGSGLTLTDPGQLSGKDVPPIAVSRPEQNYRVWLYLLGGLLILIGLYIGNRARIRHKAGQNHEKGAVSELERVVRRARSHSDADAEEKQ